MKPMLRPRIELRLTEEELKELHRRASVAKMPLATYGREMFLRVLEPESDKFEELSNRLIDMQNTFSEFQRLFIATSARIEIASMAAVAAAAMLANTGSATGEAATKVMVTHIDDALNAAPKIIEHRRKGARS